MNDELRAKFEAYWNTLAVDGTESEKELLGVHHSAWMAWQAASSLFAKDAERLREALQTVRGVILLQRDLIEQGKRVNAWAPTVRVIDAALEESK